MRTFTLLFVLVVGSFASFEAQAADTETGERLGCHEAKKLAVPDSNIMRPAYKKCEKMEDGRVALTDVTHYRANDYKNFPTKEGQCTGTLITLDFPMSMWEWAGFTRPPPGMYVPYANVAIKQEPPPRPFGPGETPIWTYESVTESTELYRPEALLYRSQDGAGRTDICVHQVDVSAPFTASLTFDLRANTSLHRSGKPTGWWNGGGKDVASYEFSTVVPPGKKAYHVEMVKGTMSLRHGRFMDDLGTIPFDFTVTVTPTP